MFTISAPQRTPAHAPTDIAEVEAIDDLVFNRGFTSSPPGPISPPFDMADIGRRITRDLDAAETAIEQGRISVAHDALIRAQDTAFDAHITLIATRQERDRFLQSTDVHLRLTNRLIDANRAKDRTIIAECRSLVARLTDGVRSTQSADGPDTGPTSAGV